MKINKSIIASMASIILPSVLSSELISTAKFIKIQDEKILYETSKVNLRIRDKASLNGKILGHYKSNAVIKSIGLYKNENNHLWVKTKYGYSSKCYMKEVKKSTSKYNDTCYDDKNKTIAKIENKQIQETTKKVQPNKYFLGASLGLTKISTSYNEINGAFTPVSSQDKDGINYSIELGQNIDKDTFAIASYNQINLDDTTFYNYLLSYNKRLKDMPYNMYAGVVGGISYSEVKKVPVANLDAKDTQTRELAYGLQLGAEQKLNNDLTLFAQYQYLKAKHSTILSSRTAKAEVVKDNFNNIMFGVRWGF